MGIFVTPSEAAFLDEGLSKRDSVDTKELSEQLSEILGNDFLGLRWNATDQKVEVFYNNDRANQKRILTIEAAIPESARRSVALSPVEMRGSRATDKELTDLASRWFEMHPKDPFILEFDQTCGKSVATIPNANRSKDMKDLLNDRLTHDFALLVDPKLEFDTISRNDFHNPHTGGLTLAIFQSGSGQLCTSSIPFRDISTGYEYVITAAHCLANHPYTGWSVKYSAGTDWYQHAGTYNSSSEIGTWSGSYYRYGANADVAWTRKKSSVLGQPKTMIHGGNHSYQGMGWWQWHPSLAIHGDPVCHSGRNWAGAVCGTIVNTNYVGSHPGVYYSGMMDSTMLGFSGDSGGTVWSPRSDGVWYMGVTSTTYVHTNWWGQTSNRMLFTHIGNVDGLHNYLDAPVGMS